LGRRFFFEFPRRTTPRTAEEEEEEEEDVALFDFFTFLWINNLGVSTHRKRVV
tara:strand:- start:286 stop:444 length:159 start_codon:yes stop_codon:yes gene_type:complete